MPVLSRVYHLTPQEQRALKLGEFRDYQADYRALQEVI